MPCRHEDDGEPVFVTPWRNSTQEDEPAPDVSPDVSPTLHPVVRLAQDVNRLRWLVGCLLGNTIDSESYLNGAHPYDSYVNSNTDTALISLKNEADYLTSTICKYLSANHKEGVYSKEVDDWWAEHRVKDAIRKARRISLMAKKKDAEQRLTDALAEVDRLKAAMRKALLQND